MSAFKGSSPNEACRAVLADIQRRIGGDKCFEIGLISLNMKVNTVFPDLSIINIACMLFELTRFKGFLLCVIFYFLLKTLILAAHTLNCS